MSTRDIIYVILLVLVVCSTCFWCGRRISVPKHETIYDTVPYVDTIPCYYPVPRDSVVIRYVTATLPAAPDTEPDDSVPEQTADSVRVQIPITQKVYSTPDYRAYVSGYRASLDSLLIFNKHYVLQPKQPDKESRWGLSVGAGAAWTPEGVQPVIFLGVSYTFKRF